MKIDAIYAIINVTDHESTLELAKRYLKSGIKIIQLRDKSNQQSHRISITEAVLEIRNKINPKAIIIINDHLQDVSLTAVDGLHLGQSDGDLINARKTIGEKKILGLSCHNIEELKKAPLSYLSYVACGPIFESKTKIGHAAVVGIEKLRLFCETSNIPVVAIGGINLKNAPDVFKAGASSCAMIDALKKCQQLEEFVSQFEQYILNAV